MKSVRVLATTVACIWLGLAPSADAALHVDITQGNLQPIPIAIPDFSGTASPNVASVVRSDLANSGLFRPLDQKSFLDKMVNINQEPNYANWRVINAQALLTAQESTQADGKVCAAFRLWDVYAQQQIGQGESLCAPGSWWRRVAHKIADQIYERITGEKGYFDTRVVFISETGPALNRKKRLAIMDQDGFDPIFLTAGDYLVLTPRFNPTTQMIAYMSYIVGKPHVYLFDIDSGRNELLGNFPNMTFSPRFSPDGNKVVMSQEKEGNSDVYAMDLRTRAIQRLTTDPGIDTAPSYSPDGSQITFESDRGGSQQVYVMNADGSNQHRISFGSGRNGTPVWSPRGDYIAFTKQAQGTFRICLMHPDGSGERVISDGWEDEGPTWAPNGRVLMFTRTIEGGRGSQIWSVDITGRNERRVQTPPGGSSDPAWSPLLQ